ncbi:MAG: AAA family ATPase [Holosporaceae bacterium]|nr:AAA family ATPase [Holosporaceae bacterium]
MAAGVIQLNCKNFRSYGRLALDFSSKFVIFCGDNGAGKTNILEAISLFSPSKGLRKAPIHDLNLAQSIPLSWNVELVIEKEGCRTFLSTCTGNGSRVAKIDSATIDSLGKFEELLWILWVIPSMNNIFIGPAADRRGFFDHMVIGYNRRHRSDLKTLAKLQKERLHVISYRKDEAWLNILEKKITEENIKITKTRLEFIKALEKTFENHPSDFLRPQIGISGTVEDFFRHYDEETAVLKILSALKADRFVDSEKQTTSIGCQKTIWTAEHPRRSFSAEKCSTGEQKAFLISLILASLRISRNTRSGIPVLLLDDLMQHLDRKRRKYLVEELVSMEVQTFLTGTELSLFEDLRCSAQVYKVDRSICLLS